MRRPLPQDRQVKTWDREELRSRSRRTSTRSHGSWASRMDRRRLGVPEVLPYARVKVVGGSLLPRPARVGAAGADRVGHTIRRAGRRTCVAQVIDAHVALDARGLDPLKPRRASPPSAAGRCGPLQATVWHMGRPTAIKFGGRSK
jgi:hypothetical protein